MHVKSGSNALSLFLAERINISSPLASSILSRPCSPEASAERVPPSPGRWSQDLLGGMDGYVQKASFVCFYPTPPRMMCTELSFHQ